MATYTTITETTHLEEPEQLSVVLVVTITQDSLVQPSLGAPTTGQIFPRGDRLA